jgi:hypothetical protein
VVILILSSPPSTVIGISGPSDLERRPNIRNGISADWNIFAGEFFKSRNFDGHVVMLETKRFGKLKVPVSDAVCIRVSFVAVFVNVTEAFGTVAPDGSWTMTRMVP